MIMIYTFKKLQLKKVPSCIGWYLSITSINDLFNIAMNEQTNYFVKKAVYSNLLNEKTNSYEKFISQSISTLADIHETNYFNEVVSIMNKSFNAQLKAIEEGTEVLVNSTMIGWTINTDCYNLLDVFISDKLVFPEAKEIKVMQYPNGSHWYVEIGNVLLNIKGKEKWDSEEEAQSVAENYLRSKNNV